MAAWHQLSKLRSGNPGSVGGSTGIAVAVGSASVGQNKKKVRRATVGITDEGEKYFEDENGNTTWDRYAVQDGAEAGGDGHGHVRNKTAGIDPASGDKYFVTRDGETVWSEYGND